MGIGWYREQQKKETTQLLSFNCVTWCELTINISTVYVPDCMMVEYCVHFFCLYTSTQLALLSVHCYVLYNSIHVRYMSYYVLYVYSYAANV